MKARRQCKQKSASGSAQKKFEIRGGERDETPEKQHVIISIGPADDPALRKGIKKHALETAEEIAEAGVSFTQTQQAEAAHTAESEERQGKNQKR